MNDLHIHLFRSCFMNEAQCSNHCSKIITLCYTPISLSISTTLSWTHLSFFKYTTTPNIPLSIVPPLTRIDSFLCKASEIQLQFYLVFDRLHARSRESEKADVIINIAFYRLITHKTWEIQLQMDFGFLFKIWQSLWVRKNVNSNANIAITFGFCHNLCAHIWKK